MTARPRLRLGVSACLLGEAVRHDGQHKGQDYLIGVWAPHVDFTSFCPEVAMGLGVPRAPIGLERSSEGILALRSLGTGEDLTAQAQQAAHRGVAGFHTAEVDGVILKARSPSCGLGDVEVAGAQGGDSLGTGIFASVVQQAFSELPVVSEQGLRDAEAREAFLVRVEVLRDVRRGLAEERDPASVLRRHRTLLRSRGESSPLGLEGDALALWLPRLGRALLRTPLRVDHERALLSLIEQVGPRMAPHERSEALQRLAEFAAGARTLHDALELLRGAVRAHGLERLSDDSYLWPQEPRATELARH